MRYIPGPDIDLIRVAVEGSESRPWNEEWCRREDSNLHGRKSTAPSRQRVYQFHHFGTARAGGIIPPDGARDYTSGRSDSESVSGGAVSVSTPSTWVPRSSKPAMPSPRAWEAISFAVYANPKAITKKPMAR